MLVKVQLAAPLLAATALAACQTAPATQSGFLASYDGMEASRYSLRASIANRRDDAASDAVSEVYLQPTTLLPGVGDWLQPAERAMVLREVDRQICLEVSERFPIASAATAEAAKVRTAIVRIEPTGRAASAASAVAGFFVPVVALRAPGTTGGLAIETELLEAGTGRQIAALSWGRDAQVVGMDSPSLSRVGDALQLAEPLGDAVGDAFSSRTRAVVERPQPDPCAAFGPRSDPSRAAAGFLVGAATGLYSPEVSGTGARAGDPNPERQKTLTFPARRRPPRQPARLNKQRTSHDRSALVFDPHPSHHNDPRLRAVVPAAPSPHALGGAGSGWPCSSSAPATPR